VAGQFREGMRADFVGLEGGPPDRTPLADLRVAFTVVDGRRIYNASE